MTLLVRAVTIKLIFMFIGLTLTLNDVDYQTTDIESFDTSIEATVETSMETTMETTTVSTVEASACTSDNGRKSLSSFLQNDIDKVDSILSNTEYVLYNDTDGAMIVSKFKRNQNMQQVNCAFYMKLKGSKYIFLDACEQATQSSLKLKYFESKTKLSALLSCPQLVDDESNEAEWANVKPLIDDFKCARLSNKCDLIVLRTTNLTNNIQVKLDINCEDKSVNVLSKIEIKSLATKFDFKTGGLCGSLYDKKCPNQIGNGKCENNAEKLFETWNIPKLGAINVGWDFSLSQLERECVLDDSQSDIDTFVKIPLNKREALKNVNMQNVILYKDTKNLLVTARHQQCSYKKDELCACAMYIRVDDNSPKYVFIDHCHGNASAHTELKYFDDREVKALKSGDFPLVDCATFIYNENDENEWRRVPKYKEFFQCGRLNLSTCQTYVVKASFNTQNIKVKFDVNCTHGPSNVRGSLSRVVLNPELNIKRQTLGICGNMVYNKTIDCPLLSSENPVICSNSSSSVGSGWILDKALYKWNLDLSQYTTKVECNLLNYDRSIQAFNGDLLKNKFFTDESRNLVLYNFKEEVLVTAKFRMCRTPSFKKATYCSCGLYLRVNNADPHIAFVDVCQLKVLKKQIQFQFYNRTTHATQKYENINCDKLILDENDENQWKQVPISQRYFKCAKLLTGCETYLIRTVGLEYNIQVRTDLKCNGTTDPIDEIIVKPALVSEQASGGLCGPWSSKTMDECNFYDEKGECVRTGNIEKIVKYWSMDRLEDDDIIIYPDIDEIIPLPPDPIDDKNLVRSGQFCRSQNDPHMKSIMNREFEFQREGTYVLYDMGKEFFITAKFTSCGSSAKCNCAIFLTQNYDEPQSAYIDFCNAFYDSNFNFGFDGNAYSLEKCKESTEAKSYDEVFTDEFWLARSRFESNFVNCAVLPLSRDNGGKINSGQFFFKTTNPDPKYVTLVEVYVIGSQINYVKVYPSRKSFSIQSIGGQQITGGLCGRWIEGAQLNPSYCDLFYRNELQQEVCIPNGQEHDPEFVKYWSINNYYPEHLDNKRRATLNTKRSDMLMQQNNNIRSIKQQLNVYQERFMPVDEAVDICNQKLNFAFNTTKNLDDLKAEFLTMCVKDLKETGQPHWADMHANILKEEYIKLILRDPLSYDQNGVIRDDILKQYGIDCLNDCSGHGKCFKNPQCNFGKPCEKIVECICETNYGSADCSVNLIKTPQFALAETCCDARLMNCEKIIGVGPLFSTNDTLYYSLELDTEATSNEPNIYQGEAVVVDSTRFEIDFPFGYLTKIRLSSVVMRVGVSYGKSEYSYQNITFYDSTCRTCANGKVNPEPISGTCVSKKFGTCSTFLNGKCDDPSPCGSAMDIGFLVQTSRGSTEDEFQMRRNALSEIIGRLNVGLEKVQVGFLYFSKITRKLLGLTQREQSNKKTFFINRAQLLPYIPYDVTPLSYALALSNSQIFSTRRSQVVPRLAVLFNDLSSDESLDSINQQALALKSQGIEVFVVGVGSGVNSNQLNTIATDANHIINIESNQHIYESITELTNKICLVNVILSLNQQYSVSVGKDEYRYFKVDLSNLGFTSFLQVEVEENTGITNMYHSFTYKNPTFEKSDNFYKRETKRGSLNSYLIDVPSNEKTLYFTIEGVDKQNEIYVTVTKIDL